MLATLHRQKTLTKLFCLYSTLPREVSVRSYPTYTTVQSTEHSGFSSESYTQQLIRSYSPKWVVQLNVSCYITIKKTEIFKNFPEFLRVFGEFQTFLKRILELLGGKFRKEFQTIFRNYVAKPNVDYNISLPRVSLSSSQDDKRERRWKRNLVLGVLRLFGQRVVAHEVVIIVPNSQIGAVHNLISPTNTNKGRSEISLLHSRFQCRHATLGRSVA